MKRIEAIIKPFKLEDVRDALQAAGIEAMTVTAVRGFGRQQGHSEARRGSEHEIDFVPKTKLEILVEDGQVVEVASAIVKSAWTGKIGDGKLFVLPVEEVIRIRTGDSGSAAL